MKLPDDLQHKIERLAAAGASSAAGRQLRAFGGRTLLASVLQEIDETVLARTLRLANAEGRELLLDVHNRRVLRVRAPSARQFCGRALSTIWQPEDTRDPETISFLRDLLDGFIAESDALQVWEETQTAEQPEDGFGISAKKLADAWEVVLAPSGRLPMVDVLDGILARHRGTILCWVRRFDGQTDCGGDAGLFEQAEALARKLERDVFAASRALPDLSRDRCVFALNRFGGSGHGVILASFDGILLTLLIRPAGLDAMVNDLQEVLHGWPSAQVAQRG
ncbi:hypothetical protein [Tropicimonas marinistellae]|uniref:hypothetical protein n=1 Tax=Tropicimonas marinistellae TaxID=1739787 RepID=UPI00082AB89A|nr:hypothetical protein [Tropicimonas marinistellae]